MLTRRVNLKPRFQDYDPLRHYTVPKNRFQGVLQTEGLVRGRRAVCVVWLLCTSGGYTHTCMGVAGVGWGWTRVGMLTAPPLPLGCGR